MIRLQRRLLIACIAAVLATPIAAQEVSESYAFLKAVRERDGGKVQQIVANPSSNAINARDPETGEAALHILARRRDIEFLAFLLGHGAQPNIQTSDGTTPLGIAAQIGWVEGAEQLLARRANVNLANNRGETPLILAVQSRQLPMVRFLMQFGADPNRQDSYSGYSALDYARRDTRNPEMLRAIEEGRPRQQQQSVMGPTPPR